MVKNDFGLINSLLSLSNDIFRIIYEGNKYIYRWFMSDKQKGSRKFTW